MVNHIIVNEKQIKFCSDAEHVGLLRSTSGNGPTLTARFNANRKALAAVLHSGLARGHQANPSASIKIEKLYALPVLLSGLGSLCLSKNEVDLVDRHFRETLRRLLRLRDKTPKCVIYFLAGCLPGSALLHLRQLCLFGMIIRLPNNILHQHARNIFEARTISPKSWFQQIRDLCLLYGLPHPLSLLKSQPTKETFKLLVKKKVVDFWESELRLQAKSLKSLKYFNADFMSLTSIHPLFLTAGRSPYKVAMATTQAVMLSGRYPCDSLLRHFSSKISGICESSATCRDNGVIDDIEHIIQSCPALNSTRERLSDFTYSYVLDNNLPPEIGTIITSCCIPSYPQFVSFLIDCSAFPCVISVVQAHGAESLSHFFAVSRTWIYTLHKERLKMRGEWKRRYN